ncbi:MAG: iron chelate uptake ABC transporter family permease subunit [Acidobacteriota bacterium]
MDLSFFASLLDGSLFGSFLGASSFGGIEWSFTLRNVLLGTTLLGVVGGVLGCFTLLRRESLLGDALAHAALPGVCIAYLITGAKSSGPLFLGALVAGVVGALTILVVVRWSKLVTDAAIGIVLSVFFGLGIMLLTYIQKLPLGNQSGLDKYLFGQAATLMPQDVQLMALLGAAVLVLLALFFKELKLLTFDREYAASLGMPVLRLEVLMTLLLVAVVVVGLSTVGAVLMVATLVTPAAAARQWTDRLGWMLVLAALIGGGSGMVGALASASVDRLPTGPVVVLVASALLTLSITLAPRRGLLWSRLRYLRMVRRIRRENLLKDLWNFGERRGDEPGQRVPWTYVMGLRGLTGGRVEATARALEQEGLVRRGERDLRLTTSGIAAAQAMVRKHRLWEVYLTRKLELAEDHVHRDADVMEHALTPAAVAQLEEVLGYPTLDPHGRPIPPARGELVSTAPISGGAA